jgi:hypothetical protein
MKVETITYAQVRSHNFSNQRSEVTVRLEDGDNAEAAFAAAKFLVDQALSGPWLPNPYHAPSPYLPDAQAEDESEPEVEIGDDDDEDEEAEE